MDSPALLDATGAPRLLRGYAASDGWLFLLVESDLPLKTDLLTLRLADGRYLSLRAAGGITAITADLEGIEPVVLTFAGCSSISSQYNPAFMQAYPHVTVRFRNDPPGTDYAVELITGAQ